MEKTRQSLSGFTLIELLVVIAIMGLLASVIQASLRDARIKARDARRVHDLSQARTAISLYFDKFNNYVESGSGCGSGGNGNGWFSYTGGAYPKSIAQCLVENGFLPTEIVDPTGGRTSGPTTGFAYMKYSCGGPERTYLYAKLEGRPQSSTATDGTCCATCDSSYGMNYYLQIE